MTVHSQLMRLGLFDARVPRYTSYPTAPQFGGSVGPAEFTQWIEAVPAGSEISLYLHVPFCRRLCWFCACRTQGTTSDDPVRAYAKVLKAEIALMKAHLAPGVKLSRLHWGGGTPTMLPAELARDLAETIFAAVPMAEGGEFSVEIDPCEIDAARLDALVDAGMNRASIGVQDFDEEIQRTIGREQPYEVTRDVAEMIRARGVKSLNADILYGLPHQTNARIADSVQKLLALSPDRVALYGYAHVPWMSRRQQMIPSDYTRGVRAGQFSPHRGHIFTAEDKLRGRIIEALMCDFFVSRAEILRDYAVTAERLEQMFATASRAFPEMMVLNQDWLAIPPHARPLTRMIARAFDAYDQSKAQHSAAV